MGNHIINPTATILVWRFGPGEYYAHCDCDCGWMDKPRWSKQMAIHHALLHSAKSGHVPALPLVRHYRSTRRRSRFGERLLARVTSWPVAVSSILLIIPVGLWAAPDAHSLILYDNVTVAVTWSGPTDCVNVWESAPGNRSDLVYAGACDPDQAISATYSVRSGDWVGADPEIGYADTIACSLAVNDQIVFSDGAARGDGHEVSCLRKWW